MRPKKLFLCSVLCLLAAILCACANDSDITDTSPVTVTTAAPTTSETVTTTQAPPAPVCPEIEQSTEEWLKVGLEYYISDREVTLDAATYFEQEGIAVLALYNDWFTYDREHAEQIAALLFRYVMDNHGYEALFDMDKRIAYKDAFLKTYVPELTYANDADAERTLSRMICDSNANYRYIIRLDGMTYCFTDYEYAISLIHRLLYNNTLAVANLKAYLQTVEGYENYFDLSQYLRYNMTLNGGVSSTKRATKIMTVNDTYAMLHETVHALSLYQDQENLWLAEGMAEYLGKSLGLDRLVTQTHYMSLFYVEQGMYDAYIAAGDLDALRYLEVYRRYTALGGQTSSVDAFDDRLFTDVYAAAEFEYPSAETLGSVYEALNGKAYTGDGAELTYKQAASFTGYLIDRFGIERVLAVLGEYERMEEIFGASYDALYGAWRESIGA